MVNRQTVRQLADETANGERETANVTCKVHHWVLHNQCDVLDLTGRLINRSASWRKRLNLMNIKAQMALLTGILY